MDYIVKKVSYTGSAQNLGEFFNKEGIPFNDLNCVNWKDYPYKPIARFRVCHNSQNILINYKVEEEMVKAVADEDNGSVWLDSCMEFFLQANGDENYYNIECNCIGTVLVGFGKGQQDRIHIDREKLKDVQRFTTLGRSKIEKHEETKWEMSLIIPLSMLFRHDIKTLDGVEGRGNVYKCGDELRTPHFLSWLPIETPTPNFHQPSFFGLIKFE